ncbi:MAG: trypsin-like peptidase domain-containing protein [Actinobacteria bacterium]|nr:MAG: trypsin-like peptidase domain-containing protein [Actinomycetota bacterium]
MPGVRAASRSVVRVLGTACGLAIEGSGWVASPGLIVTNAHVVAGEQDTTVEPGGHPPSVPAQAVAFDPTDDVAVLRVRELGLPSLLLSPNPPAGRSGAILGYPENGPFTVRPGRIGRTQSVLTQNAYGQGPVSRLLTPVRGLVQPGNSGGPVVDENGKVLTTVFAATVGGGSPAGYGVANETVSSVLAAARARAGSGGAVGTGPCAGG